MEKIILVAGATGNLGGRIVKALLKRGASVRAVVRSTTDPVKVNEFKEMGVEVMEADLLNKAEITEACMGVSCVISAVQGLRDVLIDMQGVLVDAAVAAGVPRFIPSDFASDFTQQPMGENRNFDLRKEFMERINQAPIAATSILNGAFAEILGYGTPVLDVRKKTAGYWDNADWLIDYTTMDNTADFTAAAALDDATPRILHIASFQLTQTQMAVVASKVKQEEFKLINMGTLESLAAYNKAERAAHPEGENEIYPRWQSSQYIQSMFTIQARPLDNDRYPDVNWTSAEEVIAGF
ncbi:NmrA family NAD(P)-binding protein [Mucilaginibacter sp. PAMB04274]|uniref:NmrA family NAD(P)-binding protein n=1 Tax=Mucilaginibacter sp. PAMB04274 TaxID=3138568 RepID=UPI0031F5FBE8